MHEPSLHHHGLLAAAVSAGKGCYAGIAGRPAAPCTDSNADALKQPYMPYLSVHTGPMSVTVGGELLSTRRMSFQVDEGM